MRKKLLLTLMLLPALACFAQRVHYFDTIYFKSGSCKIPVQAQQKLRHIVPTLSEKQVEAVEIEGHSDIKGNAFNNKKLSLKRATAVKLFLEKLGIAVQPILTAKGSRTPLNPARLSLNRRVQLVITTSMPEEYDTTISATTEDRYTLERLLAELRPPTQDFMINPGKDTVIKLAEGTILYYKGNSLQTGQDCKSVVLKTAEAYSNTAILLNNMHTMSDGEELVSQAMVFTEFSCGGTPLNFKPGKNISVFTPTDTVRTDVLMYKWDTLGPNHFNWHTDSTRPDVIRLPNACWNCSFFPSMDCYKPCPLFFCRIKNITKGIFSAEQRFANKEWRSCNRGSKSYRKRLRTLTAAQRAVVDSFKQNLGGWPADPIALDPTCSPFYGLIKKYGLTNTADLKAAMEKELWQPKDAVDTSASFDSTQAGPNKLGILNYYVFDVTANGWTNVDWCAKIPDNYKASSVINETENLNGLLKVIYTRRRSLAQADKFDSQFLYRYAKHEDAKWIYIGIDNNTGKPVMQTGSLDDKDTYPTLLPETVTSSQIATKLSLLTEWKK